MSGRYETVGWLIAVVAVNFLLSFCSPTTHTGFYFGSSQHLRKNKKCQLYKFAWKNLQNSIDIFNWKTKHKKKFLDSCWKIKKNLKMRLPRILHIPPVRIYVWNVRWIVQWLRCEEIFDKFWTSSSVLQDPKMV